LRVHLGYLGVFAMMLKMLMCSAKEAPIVQGKFCLILVKNNERFQCVNGA